VHGKLYFFNKQMQVYTWYGTINMPNGKANEYESVNAVKWISRKWNAGIWNQYKSGLYNPNIVGSPTLSNQFILDGWLSYTFYNEKGLFRKTALTSHLLRYDLFTERGNAYLESTNELYNQLYFGKTIGNWEFDIIYKPGIKGQFRYRNQNQMNDQKIYTDAIGHFVLVDQSANTFNVSFNTDASKKVGIEFNFDNSLVRKSKANNYSVESFVKLGSKATVAYSYGYVDIAGSEYQNKYRQAIHRIKVEYNVFSKLNIRLILQPNCIKNPSTYFTNQNINTNLAVSWEFMPGGNFYLVYNNYKNYDQQLNAPKNLTDNNHSLILKISKTF
jgi:hypothetical protein